MSLEKIMGMTFYAATEPARGSCKWVFSSEEMDPYIDLSDRSETKDGWDAELGPNPNYLPACDVQVTLAGFRRILDALGYDPNVAFFHVPSADLADRCMRWMRGDPIPPTSHRFAGRILERASAYIQRLAHRWDVLPLVHPVPTAVPPHPYSRLYTNIQQLSVLVSLGMERGATVIYAA